MEKYLHPGEIVARIRKELGLTQKELGDALGTAQNQISYAERGSNEFLLRRMARYLVDKYGPQYGYKMSDIFPEEKSSEAEIKEELKRIRQAIEELSQQIKNLD